MEEVPDYLANPTRESRRTIYKRLAIIVDYDRRKLDGTEVIRVRSQIPWG